MADQPSGDAFLELDGADAQPAVTGEGTDAPWLEADVDADATAEPSPARRRKVRAADRARDSADAASLAIVAALPREGPLLLALWPDVPPAELLRTPPPPEAFAARCDFARRALDAVGRRDADARAQAEVAQRALHRRLESLGDPASRCEAAVAELRRAQVGDYVAVLRALAPAGSTLHAADVARALTAAESRGIDAEAARGVAREHGWTLDESAPRPWSGLDALPGSPSSMDAAAEALLAHPAQGYEAVRGGAVLAWLRANGASPEAVERARDARMIAERGGSESLAVHRQAWGLGLRELRLGSTRLRAPGDIGAAVRGGAVTLDELARAAREATLGAWLRMHGWVPAAGAADLVARGELTGMKRLAWSLGEPLVVGDVGVGDPATLARAVLSRPALRPALGALHASGDLLAWLESLPPVLRDEAWADKLRRARADATRAADMLPVWRGLYAHARATPLALADVAGNPVVITSVAQLRVTAQAAEVWDALKRALRDGELEAWAAEAAPDATLPALPRPPRDEDRELNALLWALGHKGLVLEWGPSDLAVTAPEDLVRAYQRGWRQLEAQAARGYVFDWLERFHGAAHVLPAAPGAGPLLMRDVVAWLRAEAGRLPAGHLALELALVCGMRHLPLDATEPGDRAAFRGYVGVTQMPPGARRAWEPLRDHAASGALSLWLALTAAARPEQARALAQGAFLAPAAARPSDHVDQLLTAFARAFGEPVPSSMLEAQVSAVHTAPLRPTREVPARRTSWRAVLASLALGAGAAAAGGAWWTQREAAEAPEPAAPAGSEVWVQLDVKVEAERTRMGALWDRDGSGPELRVQVRPRGELVTVGPCEGARHCEGVVNAARLSPGVPFRVAVDEMDWALPERVGAAWLVWRGGREETLRARFGGATVTVTARRLAFQPSTTEPAAPVAMPLVDAGAVRARVDAGASRRRTGASRAREPARR